MKHLKFIVFVLLVSIIFVLAFQNSEAVSRTVQFRLNPVFVNEVHTPEIAVGLVMLITFFLGVILTGFCGIAERFRLKREMNRIAKELEDKDKELNSLRNLPITADDVSAGQLNGA